MSSHVRLRAATARITAVRPSKANLRRQLSRQYSSATKSQALRGMHDIYGDEQLTHSHIASVAKSVAELNGFREVRISSI
jgi:hypothetical protein